MTAVPDDAATGKPGSRFALAMTLGLLAAILVLAARADSSVSTPRLGRRIELVELIRAEESRAATLERQVSELSSLVDQQEAAAAEGAGRLAALSARVDEVLAPAGMTAIVGPGVVVTLNDSTLAESPTGDLNDLVIHEQDLQAVINALWAGGAEAMSVNGQRILATTAIRCVGNTLLLHGGVYSPPYVVRAIGDDVLLRSSLDRDPQVARFTAAAAQFQLGYAVVADPQLSLPAFEGRTPMKVATPGRGA